MNLKILKNKNFLLYAFGQATSAIGDTFLVIALSLYVLKMTGSGAQFAGVLAIGLVPKIILLPVAGVFVDRFDRKKMMILLDGIRGVFLVGVFILLNQNNGVLSMSHIYLINIFFGVCATIFDPIINTMIPFLFEKEEYSDAYAVDDVILTTVSLVAPVLGAYLLGAFGIKMIILLDAITFFISAFAELFIQFKKTNVQEKKVNVVWEIKQGFSELYNNKNIFKMTIAFSFLRLLVRPMYIVIVPFVLKVLLESPDIYVGIFNSFLLAASLTGPFLIGFFRNKFTETGALKFLLRARVVTYSFYLLLGIGGIMAFFNSNILAGLIFIICIAFVETNMSSVCAIFSTSYFQKQAPLEYLGRFATVRFTLYAIAAPIGYSFYGLLLDTAPLYVPIMMVVIGIILVSFLVNQIEEPEKVANETSII